MNGKIWMFAAMLIVLVIGAGWFLASPEVPAPAAVPAQPAAAAKAENPALLLPPPAVAAGKAVLRFREGKTAAEKVDIIFSILAEDHSEAVSLLIEALKDADAGVRLHAIQSAAGLGQADSAQVCAEAVCSDDGDVRQTAWSLIQPLGGEHKAAVCRQALSRGPASAIPEAFEVMRAQPETAHFEMALDQAARAEGERAAAMTAALNSWLVHTQVQVPAFASAARMKEWWSANKSKFDAFMFPNP